MLNNVLWLIDVGVHSIVVVVAFDDHIKVNASAHIDALPPPFGVAPFCQGGHTSSSSTPFLVTTSSDPDLLGTRFLRARVPYWSELAQMLIQIAIALYIYFKAPNMVK